MDTIRSATFPPGATGKLFVFKIMKVGLKNDRGGGGGNYEDTFENKKRRCGGLKS